MNSHLGNAFSGINDENLPVNGAGTEISCTGVVGSVQDCSPFGFVLKARSWSTEDYRYGFNGKESDDEGLGGGGSTYDYGFRIYNSSLGRFLSVDPFSVSFPWNSTYAYAENDVVRCIDVEGMEKYEMTMNLFIPFKRLTIAPLVSVKGDDRGFNLSGQNQSNRVHFNFSFDLDDSSNGNMTVSSIIGKTSYYVTNPITGTEYELWSGYGEVGKEVNFQFTSSTSKSADVLEVSINYMVSAQIPFPTKNIALLEGINPSPAIDVSGTYKFIKNLTTGQVDFSESHDLDGFPASEYFLKNIDNGVQIPTLLFTPDDEWDAVNLLPVTGDRTLKTYNNQTIVGPGGNMNATWKGATAKSENETDSTCVPAGGCVNESKVD